MTDSILRRAAARTATGLLAGALWSAAGAAQAPGLPVLQNAFFARGAAVGVNYGGGGGSSIVGGAASYAPLTGRIVLVVGAGSLRTAGATQTTAGFRVAFRVRTFGASQQIGAALFAGGGRTSHAGTSATSAPFGLSLAYRKALGTTRALAAYAAPYYDATRVSARGVPTMTGNRARAVVGADVALTPSIGAGLGVDVGAAGPAGTALSAATQFGAGLSFRF